MITQHIRQETKDCLIDSVKSSLHEAENLLHEAALTTGDRAAELRDRALASLRRTRETLSDAQDTVFECSRKAARAADEYIHDNPWQAVSIATLTGVLLGIFFSRHP